LYPPCSFTHGNCEKIMFETWWLFSFFCSHTVFMFRTLSFWHTFPRHNKRFHLMIIIFLPLQFTICWVVLAFSLHSLFVTLLHILSITFAYVPFTTLLIFATCSLCNFFVWKVYFFLQTLYFLQLCFTHFF
jgi:hypothetical protein